MGEREVVQQRSRRSMIVLGVRLKSFKLETMAFMCSIRSLTCRAFVTRSRSFQQSSARCSGARISCWTTGNRSANTLYRGSSTNLQYTVQPPVLTMQETVTSTCKLQRVHGRLTESAKFAVLTVAAPRVWNRLPADLRQLRSTQTFRRHLKTFLFAASY